mmetsp:Transcript_29805/g.44052  ORF Transcript_29805/g.44052 Transcript_29805/m.44052 type:complete len:101 (-) Transcript_29805:2546-2848(-)
MKLRDGTREGICERDGCLDVDGDVDGKGDNVGIVYCVHAGLQQRHITSSHSTAIAGTGSILQTEYGIDPDKSLVLSLTSSILTMLVISDGINPDRELPLS